jgi:hypothetical protein
VGSDQEKTYYCSIQGLYSTGQCVVFNLIFTVPKGNKDIQIVYNGTQSGLNHCLWAPWSPLPMVEQLLYAVVPGTFIGDIDIAEQS